jgi:Lar family restriction alleviation protein
MTDNPIKPCPFCGPLASKGPAIDGGPFYSVFCPQCEATGPLVEKTKEDAIAAWNKRARPTVEPLPPDVADAMVRLLIKTAKPGGLSVSDFYADVLEFHRKLGSLIGTTPKVPDPDTVDLRLGLISEEIRETMEAIEDADLAGIACRIADAIYALIGTAISYGIDIRPVWEAVQAAKTSKLGGGKRADGKHQEPPGWTAPDIAAILAAQGPLRLEPVNGHDFDSGKGECTVCGRKGYARCMAMGCERGGEA